MEYRQIVDFFNTKDSQGQNVQRAVDFILKKYNIDLDKEDQLRLKLKSLESKYRDKLQKVSYHKERLNSSWLSTTFDFGDFLITRSPNCDVEKPVKQPKPFEKLSARSQRRRRYDQVNPAVDSVGRVLVAARTAADMAKNYNLVKVIGLIIRNQENALKMLGQLKDNPGMMSHEKAFSFFIDNGFSRSQYESIHYENPARFPSYWVIGKMKKVCAPPKYSIDISPTKIKVQLQALMQHSSERIVELQKTSIIEYLDKNNLDSVQMTLLSSWGLDGSGGHSQYNQHLLSANPDAKDSDLLATATTPLQLTHSTDGSVVLWLNLMPQSIRFCRPVILEYTKECKEKVIQVKEEFEEEIEQLVPVRIEVSKEKFVTIDFKFVMSLIDGKVLVYVTETSSMQNCPICGSTPTQMTDINLFLRGYVPRDGTLCYGISPLHSWMRFFECLLHISYRIEFKKWRVTKLFRPQYDLRRDIVKKDLYIAFGIKIDQPRAGGKGTSTTGNTCRRAFSNPRLLAEILGIKEELVVRLRNILIAINVQQPINPEKVQAYCHDTYKLYFASYDWYNIPASIHKVLAHAGDIILHSPAPVGLLGEEASEGRNKYYRKDREQHARKNSREDNLFDVFMRGLNSSDPVISSVSLKKRLDTRPKVKYPAIVKDFLILEDSEATEEEDDNVIDIVEEIMEDVDCIDDDFEHDANIEME